MNPSETSVDALIVALRADAADDLAFAQRVAMTCCRLVEQQADALAGISTAFRIP